MKLTAVLSLKDNYTDTLKRAVKKTEEFRKEVNKTKSLLDKTASKRWNLNVNMNAKSVAAQTGTLAKVMVVLKAINALRIILQLRNNFKKTQQQGSSLISSMAKLVKQPFVLTFKMGKLAGGQLLSAAKSIASQAAKVLGIPFQGAVNMEQTSLSVEHLIKVNNKGMSADKVKEQASQYMSSLRSAPEFAASDSGDVQKAGRKAIAIAQGDTGEASSLLKLAADLSAVNPGKSMEDAIGALASLKTGSASALEEFGFFADEASVKSAGKDMAKVKSRNGVSLGEMYKGGSEKAGQSGAGLLTSVKNSVQNSVTDLGIDLLGTLKPEIQKLVGFLNSDGTRKMIRAGIKMISGFASVVFDRIHTVKNWISSRFLNNMDFQNLPDLKSKVLAVFGELKSSFDGWYEKDGKSMITNFFSGLVSEGIEFLVKAVPMFWDLGLKIGVSIFKGIALGLKKVGGKLWNWTKEKLGFGDDDVDLSLTSNEGDGIALNPHAFGLRRVPYDNYPALLHQNERVLTAQEARSAENKAPVTINLVAGKQVDPDLNKLLGALRSAVEASGFNLAAGGAA